MLKSTANESLQKSPIVTSTKSGESADQLHDRYRKSVLADVKIQSRIVGRFLAYAGWSLLFVTLPLTLVRIWFEPSRYWGSHVVGIWHDHFPVLICLGLFIPFAVFDLIRFSNRLVGPISRLRRELKRLKENESVPNLKFRENDFYTELAEQFNEIADYIQKLKSENEALASRLAEK